jgi:hypothetical protein
MRFLRLLGENYHAEDRWSNELGFSLDIYISPQIMFAPNNNSVPYYQGCPHQLPQQNGFAPPMCVPFSGMAPYPMYYVPMPVYQVPQPVFYPQPVPYPSYCGFEPPRMQTPVQMTQSAPMMNNYCTHCQKLPLETPTVQKLEPCVCNKLGSEPLSAEDKSLKKPREDKIALKKGVKASDLNKIAKLMLSRPYLEQNSGKVRI